MECRSTAGSFLFDFVLLIRMVLLLELMMCLVEHVGERTTKGIRQMARFVFVSTYAFACAFPFDMLLIVLQLSLSKLFFVATLLEGDFTCALLEFGM